MLIGQIAGHESLTSVGDQVGYFRGVHTEAGTVVFRSLV